MDALEQLNLAAPIVSTYSEIEETILCHIAEQLAANPDTLINATSEWRIKMLAEMGRVNKDTARIIASKVGKIPAEVQKVVQSSIDRVLSEYGLDMNGKIEESMAAALKNYDLQAVKDKYNQVNTVMQYKAKQAYVKGINSVADKLLRKKQKALENSQEYLDILNKNAMATVLGEKSRTEAIRETIAEMSKKGIPAFVDKTGREWSPEAYVDMDIRNTAKNAALAAEFASLDELGQDIILVSSHSGARPLCAPYQGKLYSLCGKSGTITDAKGKTYTYTPLSETSFGEAAGLFGINCGHRMRGVSDGAFISREKEFDGEETSEEYKRVQRQRAMEREVRKKKTEANMYEAAGDKDAARDLRRLAIDEDRKLRDYCRKEGLSYRRDRTEVYGYKNKVDRTAKTEQIKPKYNFVPANSIEEAQEFAKKYCNDGFMAKTFKGEIDFRGISLDNANAINKALSETFETIDIEKISGIKAVSPTSAIGKKAFKDGTDAVMAYSPIEHGIFINKNVLKNESTFAEYLKKSKEAWDTVINNIDKLSDTSKKTALVYKNAGRSLVDGTSVEGMLKHELGHHVQWTLLDSKTNNLVGSRMSQFSSKISGYANSSKSEYLAESFSSYLKGERDILDPEYVKFIDSKLLDKSNKNDIINNIEELFRKKEFSARPNTKPIKKEVFEGLVVNAKKKGAIILKCEYGDELYLHLERNNATASCIGDTVIFRPDATISEVLEELHHFEQNLSGLNSDKDIKLRTILNEIDAKKYILDNSKRYSIPRNEIEEIQEQLEQYQKELDKFLKER